MGAVMRIWRMTDAALESITFRVIASRAGGADRAHLNTIQSDTPYRAVVAGTGAIGVDRLLESSD